MPTWPNRPPDYYIEALRSDDFRVRRQAAAALGVTREPRAVEALIAALQGDASAEVRSNAVVALAKIGDARAAEPLKAAALGDADAEVRSTAIRALDNLKTAAPIDVYLAVLSNPDWSVRYWAIRELGEQRTARAVAPLMEMLVAGDEMMGPVLAVALGQIGIPALPSLLIATRHDDATVRAYATLALAPIEHPDALQAIQRAREDGDARVRATAETALATQTYMALRHERRGDDARGE